MFSKQFKIILSRFQIFVPPFACRFSKGKILLFSEAFRLFVNSFIVLIINCLGFFIAGLGGHMLGIADEDGWVQILDSRRTGSRSVIKGTCKKKKKQYYSIIVFTVSFFLAKDMHQILILRIAQTSCQSYFVIDACLWH